MFAKLPLLFTFALCASSALAAPAPEARALADPFPATKIQKSVRFFRVATGDLETTCSNWNYLSKDYYTTATKSATLYDCKAVNEEKSVIAAYTTQYRDDGTVWAQTGYVGTQLTLEFLIESNGKCNEVAPGLCHDPVQQYAGKLFQ